MIFDADSGPYSDYNATNHVKTIDFYKDFLNLDSIEKLNKLYELMEENPEKHDQYMDLFVNVQLEILSKRCLLLNKIKDKMKRKISLTSLDETVKYDLCTRLDGTPRHSKLCHGDFNPANIIITPDNKIYIIDWAHVTQGNASADAARTYLLFKLAKKDKFANLDKHGYGMAISAMTVVFSGLLILFILFKFI